MKINPETIFPLETTVNGAYNVPIMVDGGVLLKVTARNKKTGATRTSRQLAYVSKHVSVPYLSLSACIDLGLVPANFPEVGTADNPDTANLPSMTNTKPAACSNTGVPKLDETSCDCPARASPPC